MKGLIIAIILLFTQITVWGQVGVNIDGNLADSWAALDVKSTTKGVLVPRMTSADRISIPTPATGLLVFDTDSLAFMYYTSSGWAVISAEDNSYNVIEDLDSDTKIDVEKTANDNQIRFDMVGIERFLMNTPHFFVTSSGGSVFYGDLAGANDNLNNNYNTFIGHYAGRLNSSGKQNVAIGNHSRELNGTTSKTIAIGRYTLFAATAPLNSTIALGSSAGQGLLGGNNIGVGYLAAHGFSTANGTDNLAFGNISLQRISSGSDNIVAGMGSTLNLQTGSDNVAIGYYSFRSTYSGQSNVSIGTGNMLGSGNPMYNVAIGIEALAYQGNSQYNTVVGYQALYQSYSSLAKFNCAAGTQALFSNISGYGNVAVGTRALYSNERELNTAIGYHTLEVNTGGSENIAVGYNALQANTTGFGNTAIGYSSGSGSTNNRSVVIGPSLPSVGSLSAGFGASTIPIDTTVFFIGSGIYSFTPLIEGKFVDSNLLIRGELSIGDTLSTGYNLPADSIVPVNHVLATDGNGHVSWTSIDTIGTLKINHLSDAKSDDDGTQNGSSVFLGSQAGNSDNWSDNRGVGIGRMALWANTDGEKNVGVGSLALSSNTTGHRNVAVGGSALDNNTTANNCTAIGTDAFTSTFNYSNSTAVGYGTTITASNQARFGNSSITSIGGFSAWTNLSDRRFKANIIENVPGTELLLKLRPVTYQVDKQAFEKFINNSENKTNRSTQPIESSELQVGFIAQEVEQAANQLGFDFHAVDQPKSNKDYYGLRYDEFVPVLVKTLQEQQELLAKLKIRLEQLEKE